MKLAFQIARRFLSSGKLQTLFIVLGIGVGVSVQVFIGALISGLQKSLVDTTIGNSSQITVTLKDEDNPYISNYDDLIVEILNSDSNIRVATGNFNVAGTLEKNSETLPVLVRGFDMTSADGIYKFSDKLTSGRLPNQTNEIILGNFFQTELNLNVNDTITIQVPLKANQTLTVVGFFDFEVKSINESWAVSTLSTTQGLYGVADIVTSIESQVKESAYFEADAISLKVADKIGSDYAVTNWIENNASLLSGLQGQSISSLMIQVFVLISVVLGIASILAIIVLQKSKQIGILKAMGIKNSDASLIFLFQGLILGVFGALTGVLLGIGLLVSFQTFAIDATTGEPVIPLNIEYDFIALSALIAIAVSTAAALVPARKSSKLSVIEVIRNA
ncbi:ABC transporter permease [Acholeplasma vituli]|uniref:ABC transporter permease n=1 Tax=Paracholeplasma vituli TaxID=69473 RepID=A0ABT2PWD4_9MOLU|nr:FtsX-like permease family protein [Paracholeplasma vituli]MCU0105237.1 ABC transporter permease [Paracholeplasma vituli]